MYEDVELKRDCEAIQIPSGEKMQLTAGTLVQITQSLGGSFTVVTDSGYMVRIAAKDADAIGKEAPVEKGGPAASGTLAEQVWEQLRTCYDPEIPANVVELGLIYKCEISDHPEGGQKVYIEMTLTAPGCGMGDILKTDIEGKISVLPAVKAVEVVLVVEPPWNPSMMSEAARLQLGMM